MKLATLRKLTLASAIAGVFAISGCGGGGSTAASSGSSTSTLSGVAATGAPFANATVTLTDATGASKTATTGTDGSYTIDVTGMTAPFVIKVSGLVGDTKQTLVSVQATAPTAGQTITVNVTPLTHAIAAALSSTGDPLALDPSKDKTQIANNIVAVKAYMKQLLKNTLTTASVSTTDFDPVNTGFSADHSGVDKVIDNLQVSVAADGTVSLVNKGATTAMVDDMSESHTAPGTTSLATATNTISFSHSTDFTKAPAADLDAELADDSIADKARDLFNQCFAVPSTQRGSVAGNNLDTACQPLAAIVDASYLNNGKNAIQEFDKFLTDSGMDNASFKAPEIIRFFAADRALAKIAFQRADHTLDSFSTVIKNFGTQSAPNWKMVGNQRHFKLFVNAVADKRDELNPNATLVSSYNSGLNLYVDANAGSGASIQYVLVTGPGLGSGVVLKPSTGSCSYLTIVSNNGNTAASQKNTCASVFRLTGVAQSATATYSPWGGANPLYAPAAVSDATLQAIKPFDAYQFDIYDGTSHTYIVERLRARPLTTAELPQVHYNVMSSTTRALLTPGTASSFAGGSSINIDWTPQHDTPPVDHINVQMRPSTTGIVQNNVGVPLSATFDANGTLRSSATYSVGAPGTSTFPAASATAGGLNFAHLSAHNESDLQIIAATQYSNF